MMAATVPLGQAAQAALLVAGAGLPLAFLQVFGLPEGFPKRRGSAIDIKDMFGLIPAAIDGAVMRSQLRTLITQLRQSRALLQQSVMSNSTLIDSLNSMASSIDICGFLRSIFDAGTGKKRCDRDIYVKFIDNSIHSIKIISIDDATQALDLLDTHRGAWVSEDFYS